ncbi:MAG: hypothetical protein GY751_00320 [Bacteroidetes bacterium]|nr:hypothetical protein [Bacteroidota bacterium]
MERIQYDQRLGLFSKVNSNGILLDIDEEGSRKRTLNLNNPGQGRQGLYYDILLRTYSHNREDLVKYSSSVAKNRGMDNEDPFKGIVDYESKKLARDKDEKLFGKYQDLIKIERNLVDASKYPSITFEMLLLYKLTRRFFVGSTYQPEVDSKVKVFKENADKDEKEKRLREEILAKVDSNKGEYSKSAIMNKLNKLNQEELEKIKKKINKNPDDELRGMMESR